MFLFEPFTGSVGLPPRFDIEDAPDGQHFVPLVWQLWQPTNHTVIPKDMSKEHFQGTLRVTWSVHRCSRMMIIDDHWWSWCACERPKDLESISACGCVSMVALWWLCFSSQCSAPTASCRRNRGDPWRPTETKLIQPRYVTHMAHMYRLYRIRVFFCTAPGKDILTSHHMYTYTRGILEHTNNIHGCMSILHNAACIKWLQMVKQ